MAITFHWAAGQQRLAEAPTSCMEAIANPSTLSSPSEGLAQSAGVEFRQQCLVEGLMIAVGNVRIAAEGGGIFARVETAREPFEIAGHCGSRRSHMLLLS
jgi:hypothetical protein